MSGLILILALGALCGRGEAAVFEVLGDMKVDGGIEVSTSATAAAAIMASSTTSPGNVGIGTASPTTKLDVAGTLKASNILCPTCTGMQVRVTGVCPPGSMIRTINQDGTAVCDVTTPPSVIVLSTSTCPAGFQELPAFAGRFAMAVPPGGTAGGFLGTPLGDLGTLTHTHTFSALPASQVTAFTDLSHTHTVDFISTGSGAADTSVCEYSSAGDGCISAGDVSGHGHALDVVNFTSASQACALAGTAGVNHSHTFTPSGTVNPGDHTPPYIQVRFCMKT